jgi:hypothetical protein
MDEEGDFTFMPALGEAASYPSPSPSSEAGNAESMDVVAGTEQPLGLGETPLVASLHHPLLSTPNPNTPCGGMETECSLTSFLSQGDVIDAVQLSQDVVDSDAMEVTEAREISSSVDAFDAPAMPCDTLTSLEESGRDDDPFLSTLQDITMNVGIDYEHNFVKELAGATKEASGIDAPPAFPDVLLSTFTSHTDMENRQENEDIIKATTPQEEAGGPGTLSETPTESNVAGKLEGEMEPSRAGDALSVLQAASPAPSTCATPSQKIEAGTPSDPPPQGEVMNRIAQGQAALVQSQSNQLRALVLWIATAPRLGLSESEPAYATFLHRRRPQASRGACHIIDELEARLTQCFDARGRISRESAGDAVLDLMLQAVSDENKVLLIEVLKTSTDTAVLERLVHNGVLRVLKHWVLEYNQATDDQAVLRFLLETLRDLPVTYESLRGSGLVALITKIKKDKLGGESLDKGRRSLGRLAEEVRTAWKKRVKEAEGASGPNAPLPPRLVPRHSVPPDALKPGRESTGATVSDAKTLSHPSISLSSGAPSRPVNTDEGAGAATSESAPIKRRGCDRKRPIASSTCPKGRTGLEDERGPSGPVHPKPKLGPPSAASDTLASTPSSHRRADGAGENKGDAKDRRRVVWRDEKGGDLLDVLTFDVEEEVVGGEGGDWSEGTRHDRIQALAMRERQKEMELFKDVGGGFALGEKVKGRDGANRGAGAKDVGRQALMPTTAWRVLERLVVPHEKGGKRIEDGKTGVLRTPETVRLDAAQKLLLEVRYIRDGDIPFTPSEGLTVQAPQEGFTISPTIAFRFPTREGDVATGNASRGSVATGNSSAENVHAPLNPDTIKGIEILKNVPGWIRERLLANGMLHFCLASTSGLQKEIDQQKVYDVVRLLQAAETVRLEPHVQTRLCRNPSRFLPCVSSDGGLDMGLLARAFAEEDREEEQQFRFQQQQQQRDRNIPFHKMGGSGEETGRETGSHIRQSPLGETYSPPPRTSAYSMPHASGLRSSPGPVPPEGPLSERHVPRFWKPCKYFAPRGGAGSCRFGNRCRYLHEGISVRHGEQR